MLPLAILDVSGDVALTVLGAVAVAGFTGILTAVTTNSRLDCQLDAEHDRLGMQLDHERIQADRAELRTILDAAGAAATETLRWAGRVSAGIEREHFDTELEEARDRIEQGVQAAIETLLESISGLTPHVARLQLRLGQEHPVSKAYWNLRSQGNAITAEIPDELPASDSEARVILSACEDYSRGVRVFLDEAHALVASRLD